MQIETQLDPILEIGGLLLFGADADKTTEIVIETLDNVAISGKLFFEKHLSGYKEYLRSFTRHRTHIDDEITFSLDDLEFHSLAASPIICNQDFIYNTDKMTDEELRHLIVKCYNETYETEYKLTAEANFDSYFDFVSKTTVSESTKWQLIALLQEPKPFYKRYSEMIRNAIPAFEQARRECSGYVDRGLKYFSETADQLKLTGDYQKIIPMVSNPVSLYMMDNIQYCGVYWNAVVGIVDTNKPDSQQMAAALKALTDKSRLEILSLLKRRPMYSLELAEKLALSPATISHHMNVLIVQNLVTVEKQGGRGYYHLNHDTITAIVRQMEKSLL